MAESAYTLYFGTMRIAKVQSRKEDFPNLWGRFDLDPRVSEPTTPDAKRMLDFIRLNRASMRLVDVMHEQNVDSELDAVNKQLEPYDEWVESDAWFLEGKDGKRLPILCPMFRDGGQIVWRWRF